LVSVWGRRRVPESGMFLEQQQEERASTSDESNELGIAGRQVKRQSATAQVKAVVGSHWVNMIIGAGSVASIAIVQYGVLVWGQSFVKHAGMTANERMLVDLFTRVLMIALAMPIAWLADRVGVGWVTLVGALSLMLGGVPLWSMLQRDPDDFKHVLLSLGLGFGILGSLVGTVPFFFVVELFPTSVRNTAVGISLNIGYTIFGGLAPILAQASLEASPLGPGILYAIGGFISALSILLGLFLQSRGVVQLAHVRKEPHFERSCGFVGGGGKETIANNESESDVSQASAAEASAETDELGT